MRFPGNLNSARQNFPRAAIFVEITAVAVSAGGMSFPAAVAAAIMGEFVMVEEVNSLATLINLLVILTILGADG